MTRHRLHRLAPRAGTPTLPGLAAAARAQACALALRLALGLGLSLGLPGLPGLPGLQLAQAGEGHDHGSAPAAPVAHGPQRLPDSSVLLPKPAQRQLGVRTVVVAAAALPRTVTLNGTLQMDPNAGGRVQPLNAGRIEPGPRGLPSAGQAVRRGEVLAYVASSAAPIERANQAAQLAELRAAQQLAGQRLARLQALADTVPRKDIEAAQAELASLAGRQAAVAGSLATREALVAPLSGVIASAHVVSGQVVDARELLFEIVDPRRLRVEALSYEPALAADIGSATLLAGERRLPLAFVGAARSLREQALPLAFRVGTAPGAGAGEGVAALDGLALGQAVRVLVHTRATLQGMALPAAALGRNSANQTVVWVKTGPERFAPRVVTAAALDGERVAVTAGLQAGERVATQGAALIQQIR